ncbi:MAG TPA: hypothetical protein PKD86_16710 [Gemmatales bacterium]|nr:hypothetical protein [Gemmatales bacterium]
MTESNLADRIAAALHPERCVTAAGLSACLVPDAGRQRRWELFRGQLVDPLLTREERWQQSWELHLISGSAAPAGATLAVRFDPAAGLLHVTRGFPILGEVPQAEGNIISTRPAERWSEELIASRRLGDPPSEGDDLSTWLERALFLATVGTSRLAITSPESPLPVWSWGLLHYQPRAWSSPESWWQASGDRWAERFRWARCEFELRRTPSDDMAVVAARILEAVLRAGGEDAFDQTLRGMLRQLALTPGQRLIANWLTLLAAWRDRAPDSAAWPSFLTHTVRLLHRHLTAFDLERFHNQGANYPDALLVDGLVKLLLPLRNEPGLAAAWALACRLRQSLTGLWVPPSPTSPGESLRVRPAEAAAEPTPRVQSERSGALSRLFVDEPLTSLLAGTVPPSGPFAVRELGLALFLDRPLGLPKLAQRVALDRTPLVSYLAFSRELAQARLDQLLGWGWITLADHAVLAAELGRLVLPGIAAQELPLPQPRPGVVSLEDARLAAADFVYLATTAPGRAELWHACRFTDPDWEPFLDWLLGPGCGLVIRSPRARCLEEPEAFLTAYDAELRPRLEFSLPAVPTEVAYMEPEPGREVPAEGLVLCHAWDETGQEQALPTLRPRLVWEG